MSETPFTWFTPLDQLQERPMTPSAPSLALTAVSDAPAYEPNATMQFTVTGVNPVGDTATFSATDPSTGAAASVAVDFVVNFPALGLNISASDTLGLVFTPVSADNGVYVFTAVAPADAPVAPVAS